MMQTWREFQDKLLFLTQVATYKILGANIVFHSSGLIIRGSLVAYTVSLGHKRHNLEDYATRVATCVIFMKKWKCRLKNYCTRCEH